MSGWRDVAPSIGRFASFVFFALIALCASAQQRGIAAADIKSGFEFLGPDLKKMQLDDFANPGGLWVDRGAKLWSAPAGAASKSCADCHGDARSSMKGVSAKYPRVEPSSGRLMTLEGRIMQSRTEHQKAPPLAYESAELLALTAFIARQSAGMPVAAVIDGPARKFFEAGEAFFFQRRGQLNLSCAHCHDANWGRTLYAERISQGHPTAYPGYRLEWQTMGSLERRLRACLSGVRAEILPYGSPDYANLALYLYWRANGLSFESPGVRR